MIYHIFANRSNIGDWLSAKGIQKLLGNIEITECFCDEPFVEVTTKILSNATSKDLIIIGGGGLLMDYFIPFWEAFKPVADRVPFCIWGIGYCDIKHEPSLPPGLLIEEIIAKSKLTIVRDELTRSYLHDLALPAPIPCPSINIIDPILEKGNDILHVVNYTTAGEEAYEAMCEAAKVFAKNTSIVYRETNNIISKGNEQQLAHILSLYETSGIIISSALHGCIIGVAMGLKVLAVSGDCKIDAFMELAGLKDWVLDTTQTDQLRQRLAEIKTQVHPRGLIKTFRQQNKDVAARILQLHS